MPVEIALCRRIVEVFRAALPGVEVSGNWLPAEDGGFKGEPEIAGSALKISVSPRGYPSFTDRFAEFRVTVEGSIRVEDDADGRDLFICCSKILSVLSGWQDDIAAVKRDLSTDGFDPVGYRMESDGDLDIEDDTLRRKYNQSFTLKGRIKQT